MTLLKQPRVRRTSENPLGAKFEKLPFYALG